MGLLERVFHRPQGLLGRVGGWIMAHTNRDTAAWAIDRLRLAPTDQVLEVGVGPGVGLELAVEQVPRGRIAGIDPSPAMLAMARERNQAAIAEGRVELTRGVAERLPWPPATFDAVFAVNTLPLWSDPDEGLVELRRVLADDGTIVIAFTPRFADSATGVPDRLTRAGFQRARRLSGDAGVCVVAEPLPQGKTAQP